MSDLMVYLLTDKLPGMFVQYVLVTATILLSVMFALNRVLGRNSPATRYATWVLGVTGVVVIPALPYVAHVLGVESAFWNVPLLPAAAVFETRIGAGAAGADAGVPVLQLLTWIWLTGAVLMLTGLARSVTGIARITRRAGIGRSGQDKGSTLNVAVAFALAEASRPVRIAVSDEIATPIAWGLLRPTILLPRSAEEWPLARSVAVLRHELAHIRRGDWAGAILLEIVRSLFWPNPLVWCAGRMLRFEQEQACDDAVLRGGTVPVDYARHLLDVATSTATPAIPRTGLAMARPSNLRSRVHRILERHSDRRPASRFAVGLAFLLVAAVSPALATFDPWHCDQQSAPALTLATSPGGYADHDVGARPSTPTDPTTVTSVPATLAGQLVRSIRCDRCIEGVGP